MFRLFISSFMALFLAFGCGSIRDYSPPPVSREAPQQKPLSGDEWNDTLLAAKKEGKIFLYSTYPPQLRKEVSEGFSKRTGINIEIVIGGGAEISAKLLAERRAELFLADAYVGGTTTLLTDIKPKGILLPIEPMLFLPEVLDTKLWFKNTLPWLDKDKMVLQTRMMPGGSQVDVVFNTHISEKSEFVSWYDLLNPKYKGKINLQDPTAAGKGGKFINKAITYYGLNWDFMKALAKQDPFLTRDKRLMLEWVAQGKHLLAINPDSVTYEEFKDAGASIGTSVFKETKDVLGGGYSGVAAIDKAPHPHAAKLFINWFLSKEGQTYYARADGSQSAREDVPTDHLKPDNIRKLGVEYAIETEEFVLQEAKLRPRILEIFGPLLSQ